jgi:hypothetical protein
LFVAIAVHRRYVLQSGSRTFAELSEEMRALHGWVKESDVMRPEKKVTSMLVVDSRDFKSSMQAWLPVPFNTMGEVLLDLARTQMEGLQATLEYALHAMDVVEGQSLSEHSDFVQVRSFSFTRTSTFSVLAVRTV